MKEKGDQTSRKAGRPKGLIFSDQPMAGIGWLTDSGTEKGDSGENY